MSVEAFCTQPVEIDITLAQLQPKLTEDTIHLAAQRVQVEGAGQVSSVGDVQRFEQGDRRGIGRRPTSLSARRRSALCTALCAALCAILCAARTVHTGWRLRQETLDQPQ